MKSVNANNDRCDSVWVSTTLPLDARKLLATTLQPGDRLRSSGGTVWITVAGEPRDIVLAAGQQHVVATVAVRHVSGLGSAACASVRTRGPLDWQPVLADRQPGWLERWRGTVAAIARMPACPHTITDSPRRPAGDSAVQPAGRPGDRYPTGVVRELSNSSCRTGHGPLAQLVRAEDSSRW